MEPFINNQLQHSHDFNVAGAELLLHTALKLNTLLTCCTDGIVALPCYRLRVQSCAGRLFAKGNTCVVMRKLA